MPGSLELQGWILLAIAEGLIVASRRTGVVTFQKNLMVSRFAISALSWQLRSRGPLVPLPCGWDALNRR